jgi:purine-binding chemotaxis protein CheW
MNDSRSNHSRSAPTRHSAEAGIIQLVTVVIDNHCFGFPINRVRDVFIVTQQTPIPLAPHAVAGLVNLRGRVVTTISLRRLFGIEKEADVAETTAVGIDWKGETFGLLVDSVGEVLTLPISERQPVPAHLDARWARISTGVHRMGDRLLLEIDIDALLDADIRAAA